MSTAAAIRRFEPPMADDVIAVVRRVHDEYGFMWDYAGYHRDLYDIPSHYLAPGGAFWTLEVSGGIAGCVGVTPHGKFCELHRLYICSDIRGRGLGQMLLQTAIEWGRARGFAEMIAWSDVKLGLAHKLYLANGFVLNGRRQCDDPDSSIEHGFRKAPL